MWPWPPGRFVIPILIFLLGYSLNEIWNGLRNGHRFRGGKALASVICGILILGNVWNTYQVARFNGGTHYPSMIASSDTPVAWSSFLNMFAWIRANTGPADIIASPFDSMVFLYTERVAFRPFSMRPTSLFYGDPTPPATIDQLFSGLTTHKAQYLMRTPMLGFGEEKPFSQLVEEFRKKRPGCLRLVYVGDDPRFMIFKVQP